jgi:hypothetical protein
MIGRTVTALGLFALTTASAGAVQCVNPGGTGGCFASIQDAVDASTSGELIDIAAGTYAEHVQIPGGPEPFLIGLTLLGAGAGATIADGGGTGDVITVRERATAAISGMTLRNGSTGLRALASSTVTLMDSEVSGNLGGGIAAGGRAMTILRTTVMGNTSSGNGDGIEVQIGRVFVTESLVSQNTAFRGGGLYAARGIIAVERSTFSDNDAVDGGGIYGERRARLTVTDSEVVGNASLDAGEDAQANHCFWHDDLR